MPIPFALAAAAAVAVPPQPALTEQIAAVDSELFQLLFEQCDPQRMAGLLAEDLEFYHDKAGAQRGRDSFVAQYAKDCAARADPAAWRSRRELVRSSLHVDPVPGHGAIETGEHLFFERKGADGTEKLAGRAKFAQLWTLGSDGKWRLSRVLSYAHVAAKQDNAGQPRPGGE